MHDVSVLNYRKYHHSKTLNAGSVYQAVNVGWHMGIWLCSLYNRIMGYDTSGLAPKVLSRRNSKM